MTPTENDEQESDDFPSLRPHLSTWWAWSMKHVLLCGLLALFFAMLNWFPIRCTDIWGHVHYGHWILDHGQLPAEDPFVPLAQGVRIVDSAWLSQVIFASVERMGGAEALSSLYAITVTVTYVFIGLMIFRHSHRFSLTILGTFLVLVMASTRLLVIRPEIFGGLSFALLILLTMTVRRNATKEDSASEHGPTSWFSKWGFYAGVLLIFLFWGNAHGSFPVGLVFLGCLLLGRIVEVGWTTRSPAKVLADATMRRWLFALELAVVGTLINPYGIDSLINAVTFSSNPNLRDIQEWAAMHTRSFEGLWILMSVIIMLFVFRHSRLCITPADVLLLSVFGIATIFNVRMAIWYAFVFGMVIIPHLHELLSRRWPVELPDPAREETDEDLPGGIWGRTYYHTLVCGLFFWCSFALSPISQPILGGDGRKPEQLYSDDTPLGVTNYLRENPPSGQIWNPQWWGDWLAWQGPENLKVFMTTMSIHATPPQVWRDYMMIASANGNWQRHLEKYRVTTLVIDKTRQTQLDRQARRMSGWSRAYEDEQALVLTRDPALLKNIKQTENKRSTKSNP
ncbi:MAG: hypothetical protein Tsb009_22710 [Planctomycetaceae bacterium]